MKNALYPFVKDRNKEMRHLEKLSSLGIRGVSLQDKEDEVLSHFVEVAIQRDIPIVFGIKEAHVEDLLKVFVANQTLLKEDLNINLFEVQTIMDKIPKEWIYSPIANSDVKKMIDLNGTEISDLFINYFKSGVYPNWLVPDCDLVDFSLDKDVALSDLKILQKISWLYFETKDFFEARLTIDRISFVGHSIRADDIYLQNRKVQYQDIIDTVREKFEVPYSDEKRMESIKYECVMKYLEKSSVWKISKEECIEFAKDAHSAADFKRKFKRQLKELKVSLFQSSLGSSPHDECYSISVAGGLNNGFFSIRRRGIRMAYKNESEGFNGFCENGRTYKGEELWEVCFSTLKEHI